MANESSCSCAAISASTVEFSALEARYRSIGRLPNHLVISQLLELNQQNRHLEAELLLYLGELDRRQIYREQAVASAFEFCVLRLGYSEDVAFKRVGAARLMQQFPLIYDLLVNGRIHLTALMLLKPHLTEENHEEWLLLACEKSKRQVEKFVASRCPRPDVPASIRKLPAAKQSPLETTPADLDGMECASAPASRSTTQAMATQGMAAQLGNATASTLEPAAARVVPLSSKTYRVTFTAGERLKQKLDRASELLSHCIPPSDLPALVERALDQLLEREEKRRFGAHPRSIPQSVEPAFRVKSSQDVRTSNPQSVETACGASLSQAVRPSNLQLVELATAPEHESCQDVHSKPNEAQDPDPAPALDFAPTRIGHGSSSATALASDQRSGTEVQRAAVVKAKRRRCVPAAVRRAVFERDSGQCTYIDQQGRRCGQHHFLEFDHIDAHALGGAETATNLRLRCAMHNALEAERLFGRERVKSAIKHAKQRRSR